MMKLLQSMKANVCSICHTELTELTTGRHEPSNWCPVGNLTNSFLSLTDSDRAQKAPCLRTRHQINVAADNTSLRPETSFLLFVLVTVRLDLKN